MRNVITGEDGVYKTKSASRYWDARLKCHIVKILPGEYAVGEAGEMIVTILGSCIAACIYEKVLGIGGMNHFMLPFEKYKNRSGENNVTDYKSLTARYGNVAMEMLINEIIKKGGMRYNLEAKIFGGASITDTSTDIGAENIAFVREYLAIEKIKILSEDVGGFLPRKIYYNPTTNDVYVKRIERANAGDIIVAENACRKNIKDKEADGKVYFLDT